MIGQNLLNNNFFLKLVEENGTGLFDSVWPNLFTLRVKRKIPRCQNYFEEIIPKFSLKNFKSIYKIAPNIIKWPHGEVVIIKEKFKSFAGIENVIGAIDGTYIPIKTPKEDAEVFNTRKCFYAYTLQCITELSLKFTGAYIGYPDSVKLNVRNYFDNKSFIIGDKAYPLKTCIPLYIKHKRLNNAEVYFNKTRFNSFTVLASCVLHNICIDHEDLFVENYVVEGKDCIYNESCNTNYEVNQEARQCLAAKRNAICYNLDIERQKRIRNKF
ncbi:hypothetical protein ACFW04_013808 [Cataglyphis niger]